MVDGRGLLHLSVHAYFAVHGRGLVVQPVIVDLWQASKKVLHNNALAVLIWLLLLF